MRSVDRFNLDNPLARFAGYPFPCPQPSFLAYPSGYVQGINGSSIPSPLLPNADPSVGSFVRGADIPGDVIGGGYPPQYTPANVTTADIGDFSIGDTAIGDTSPYHGTITFIMAGGGIGSLQVGIDAIQPYGTEVETPWPLPDPLSGIIGQVTLTVGTDEVFI